MLFFSQYILHVRHSLNCVADIVYICAAVGSGSWLCIHSDDAPC